MFTVLNKFCTQLYSQFMFIYHIFMKFGFTRDTVFHLSFLFVERIICGSAELWVVVFICLGKLMICFPKHAYFIFGLKFIGKYSLWILFIVLKYSLMLLLVIVFSVAEILSRSSQVILSYLPSRESTINFIIAVVFNTLDFLKLYYTNLLFDTSEEETFYFDADENLDNFNRLDNFEEEQEPDSPYECSIHEPEKVFTHFLFDGSQLPDVESFDCYEDAQTSSNFDSSFRSFLSETYRNDENFAVSVFKAIYKKIVHSMRKEFQFTNYFYGYERKEITQTQHSESEIIPQRENETFESSLMVYNERNVSQQFSELDLTAEYFTAEYLTDEYDSDESTLVASETETINYESDFSWTSGTGSSFSDTDNNENDVIFDKKTTCKITLAKISRGVYILEVQITIIEKKYLEEILIDELEEIETVSVTIVLDFPPSIVYHQN